MTATFFDCIFMYKKAIVFRDMRRRRSPPRGDTCNENNGTPCDGIGPEITGATMEGAGGCRCCVLAGARFDYEETGFTSLEKYGTTLRDETLDRAKHMTALSSGHSRIWIIRRADKGGVNVSAGFRVKLDLYANVRPARSRPFLNSAARRWTSSSCARPPKASIPIATCMPARASSCPRPDMALSVRKITAHACERIARAGFVLAMKRAASV